MEYLQKDYLENVNKILKKREEETYDSLTEQIKKINEILNEKTIKNAIEKAQEENTLGVALFRIDMNMYRSFRYKIVSLMNQYLNCYKKPEIKFFNIGNRYNICGIYFVDENIDIEKYFCFCLIKQYSDLTISCYKLPCQSCSPSLIL